MIKNKIFITIYPPLKIKKIKFLISLKPTKNISINKFFKNISPNVPAYAMFLRPTGAKIWVRGEPSPEPHTLCCARVSETKWSENAVSP